jgi:hypothetical protein
VTSVSKRAALLFIVILTVSSLAIVESAFAQSIPKPSVPEFTVKFVNASYSVTTTNPYTGVSETSLVVNNSIKITIKNQPFDYSNNGLTYQIYYNIRIKPHFSNTDNWTEVYPLENLTSSPANANGIFPFSWYIYAPIQSNSTSTIIDFQVVPTDVYQATGYDIYGTPFYGIPIDSQLDFQVEALVGHNSTYWYVQHPLTPTYGGFSVSAVAYDSASGWSNTQTITIPTSTTSPTDQTPTATPDQETQQEPFPTLLLVAVTITIVAAVVVYLLVCFKKRKR